MDKRFLNCVGLTGHTVCVLTHSFKQRLSTSKSTKFKKYSKHHQRTDKLFKGRLIAQHCIDRSWVR